ncbi:MAG TPA: DNA methyltransferase [Herpetosiphonaceae bacterium]|nr:DNA methyltransferase [Herpetosiphonaceae bacterium]
MPALVSDLRSLLEKQIVDARQIAESAARAALRSLAVDQDKPFAGLDEGQRRLRNALRAQARQLGNGSQVDGWEPLVEAVAYEQWHRMLFARFLAENHLLMHPVEQVAVTLEDCAELAADEGEPDAWMLAARYASAMLPGIFRVDDPAVQVRFAPEGRTKLEGIVQGLPAAVFTADDSLGWVYQFWQTKKKDEVNRSGKKIGAEELPAVTQLFTEDYMVRFLLENSLGAWWAARHPESPLLKEWAYLRFQEDGTPAAGTFPGWPERTAAVTVMDPCCGSGHFLVAAFEMLRRMRMEEEGLSEVEGGDAVLRDNLFALEIDPRCTQIAAFALAFATWKAGGYRQLPLPNIACSGIGVSGRLEDWTKLAGDDRNLAAALERLYHLFKDAPTLGSLINPADVPLRDRMFTPDFARIEPLLQRALAKEQASDDPVASVFGAAVAGVARAARLLAETYTLVATNVPYLKRGKQSEQLRSHCSQHHSMFAADLATVFLDRCNHFCKEQGSYAYVTPQNWLFLGAYQAMRQQLLNNQTWLVVARLGTGAFETISGEIVNVALCVFSNHLPHSQHLLAGIDVSSVRSPSSKAKILKFATVKNVSQVDQNLNPDSRIAFEGIRKGNVDLLSRHVTFGKGSVTGDGSHYLRKFWEIPNLPIGYKLWLNSPDGSRPWAGREHVVLWDVEGHTIKLELGLAVRGHRVLGKPGVAIAKISNLPCTLYDGELFDDNLVVLAPEEREHMAALWYYCKSPDFRVNMRTLDVKLGITAGTFVKAPFDLEHWQKVADEAAPLPEPYSNDPTQWLFEGHPVGATEPLQVAVARMLGYRWPQQKTDAIDANTDEDGIMCLPPVGGEAPATERLRALLAVAYGDAWTAAERDHLLQAVSFGGKGLDVWLRDGFFAQHCSLFHNRPFIWHIWDGRKDGFSALVNYHRLDGARLNRLIYTYLGAWIASQKAQRDEGIGEAEGRLVAALQLQKKLEAIRDGEPPYDIYVRWKALHAQPIGWEPDLNDGVRLNIRPFVTAGVLRSKFTINWNKDRGTNPDGSERLNDLHYTNAMKREARQKAGG